MRAALLLVAACGGASTTAPVGNVAVPSPPPRAVLVVHPAAPDHAYVLGCTRSGEPLAAAACAELLVGTELELVTGSTRTAVRAQSSGLGSVCPSGEEPDEPYLTIAGLPVDLATPAFIVSSGLDASTETRSVPAEVASQHGPVIALPKKGPGPDEPELVSIFEVDLDSDGERELVIEQLGQYLLYAPRGSKLGSVGCAFG